MIHVMTYDELRAALMVHLFTSETYCDKCECDIDLDGEGGHIYPDGSVLCPICEDAE
jgi:hypothetical protein